MSIQNIVSKIKPSHVVTSLAVLASFGLGSLFQAQAEHQPIVVLQTVRPPFDSPSNSSGVAQVRESSNVSEPVASKNSTVEIIKVQEKVDEKIVASKTGKSYHLASCPGAKQISKSNLITFTSIEEAKAAGYVAAKNCKGLR
jgi:hypothetical protein